MIRWPIADALNEEYCQVKNMMGNDKDYYSQDYLVMIITKNTKKHTFLNDRRNSLRSKEKSI
jgi:hypothetical protein